MINKSIWLKGIKNRRCTTLKNNIETDILIIGGGITGLSCAYFLRNYGFDITLVDSERVGYGQSSNSTGKLTYLQGSIYEKISNMYDISTASSYLNSQKDAIELVKDIIIENNIKCDFESNNSFVFTNKASEYAMLDTLVKLLENDKIKYKNIKVLPIKFPCSNCIKVDDTAVFNPVKYMGGLKEIIKNSNVNIYEKTKIIGIEKCTDEYIAQTENYKIKAKKIILACHYPFFLKPYFFPFKTKIKKGYLCASLTDKNRRFNAISDDDNVHSIRYHSDYKDYVIYAGEERNLGSNMDNEKNFDNLFWVVKTQLSENIKYYWFNYDIQTSDCLPLIGYLEKDNPNLLIATGYNAWGMTNGTIAGKIISELIMQKENKYSTLFDPNREFNVNKLTSYLSYNLLNGYHYILSKINKNPAFYKASMVKEIDGIKYGIYTDEDGNEFIVNNKCPHMGCGLVFNNIDKTWDCPCHGSRFDIKGKAVKGPSIYNISVDKRKQ